MKTIFVDVDTQVDFLYPAGSLYVPGAEKLIPTIAALNRHAASRGHLVVSTMDAQSENDTEFRLWPPHCVAGTAGQLKPGPTLLEKRVVIPNRGDLPSIHGAQQVLLEKQTVDCFTSVHMLPLLEQAAAERYVVYGVVTEICVKHALFGLLKTGRKVELVTDAIKELDSNAAGEMLRAFEAAGGVLTGSASLL